MANPFEAEIRQSAQALGLHYVKIPIAHKLVRTGAKTFMMPLQENPYDSFLVAEGIHHALELKSSKEWESFPFSRIEPHQRDGLQQVEDAGGCGWVLINFRQRTSAGKRKLDNQAWAFRWRDWLLLEYQETTQLGRKSLPQGYFTRGAYARPLPRIPVEGLKGKFWDLTVLFR